MSGLSVLSELIGVWVREKEKRTILQRGNVLKITEKWCGSRYRAEMWIITPCPESKAFTRDPIITFDEKTFGEKVKYTRVSPGTSRGGYNMSVYMVVL